MTMYKFTIFAYTSTVELATIAEKNFEDPDFHHACYAVEYGNPGTYFHTDSWDFYSRVYDYLKQRNLCDEKKTELDNFATLIRHSSD